MQGLGLLLLSFIMMLIFQTILTDNIFGSFNTTNNNNNTNTIGNQLESTSGGIILGNITSNMSSVNQLESVSEGLIESTSSAFKFKNFVTDGK